MEPKHAFFLAGVLLSLFGWRRDLKLRRSGAEAAGKITHAATYPQVDEVSSGQYRLFAEFTAADGRTYTAGSRFATRSPNKLMKTEAAIVYDGNNPDHCRFKRDISIIREAVVHGVIAAIGLVLFLVAVL